MCVHVCVHAQCVCVCVYHDVLVCFFFLYYCDKQHDLRQVEEERLYLILQLTLNIARKTGQKLKQEPGAGTEVEATDKYPLLVHLQ